MVRTTQHAEHARVHRVLSQSRKSQEICESSRRVYVAIQLRKRAKGTSVSYF